MSQNIYRVKFNIKSIISHGGCFVTCVLQLARFKLWIDKQIERDVQDKYHQSVKFFRKACMFKTPTPAFPFLSSRAILFYSCIWCYLGHSCPIFKVKVISSSEYSILFDFFSKLLYISAKSLPSVLIQLNGLQKVCKIFSVKMCCVYEFMSLQLQSNKLQQQTLILLHFIKS